MSKSRQGEALELEEVSPLFSYTVQLSVNLNPSSSSPMETVVASVEPYGAVTLYRFVSGERVAFFDLSSAEVDALIAANRRRRSLMKRMRSQGVVPSGDLPF